MGAITSKCDPFSDERCLTLETKYELNKTIKRSMFPMRVNIYSSHGGLLQDIAYQDIDVYFLKETKMIMAVSEDGKPRLIPLNAAVKCSVIDDFDEDLGKCLQGRTYKGIAALFEANPVPKVVHSEQGYYHKDYSHTVEREDVLIVKELTEKNGHVALKCHEAYSNEARWLERPIDSTFTTESSKVTMDMASLFSQLELPAKILLTTINDKDRDETDELNNSIYTFTNYITRKSVIASVRYSGDSLTDKDLFEVYLDVPLEIEIIKLTKLEMQKLRVEAQQVFSDFNSSKPRRIVINPTDKIQSLILHNLKKRCETGIQLVPPEPSYTNNFPDVLMRQLQPTRKISRKGGMNSHLISGKLKILDLPKECHSEKLTRKISSINYGKLLNGLWTPRTLGCSSDDISNLQEDDHNDYVDMDGINDTSTKDNKPSLEKQNSVKVTPKIHIQQAATLSVSTSDSLLQTNIAKENRTILKQFSIKQVVDLLIRLHLSEYCKIFEKEAINGSLLLDFDDCILNELGMHMKLHRLKMLRIIDGRESVKELMNNNNNAPLVLETMI